MLDELLIHGMRIAALEVIGKAGNYAGVKVAKRYTIEEPIQNAVGGGTKTMSHVMANEFKDNNINK